ncbi:epoxide hydrolase, soluble (sEH) [Allomyces arbusculus]|nr:epoxide hydrolase, soluble (sEH) [Allomyces arbusculus]
MTAHAPGGAPPPAQPPAPPLAGLSLLETAHEDLVHDLQFDFYGTRLVTASSDQKLKVWDCLQHDRTSWQLSDAWKAHDASIVRVTFAHPDYGTLLASCSFDRTVRIWEELDHEPRRSGRRWVLRARLVDSRAPVTDLAFAPAHLGLRLATASADGTIRIYEAMDVVNLATWTLTEEIQVVADPRGDADGPLSVSWCKAKHLYSVPVPAHAADTLPPSSAASNGPDSGANSLRGLGGTPFFTPSAMLVVGGGRAPNARIYYQDAAKSKWFPGDCLVGHQDLVNDVSWAPSMGRSYQLIATACRDGKVRVFRIASGHSQYVHNPPSPAVDRNAPASLPPPPVHHNNLVAAMAAANLSGPTSMAGPGAGSPADSGAGSPLITCVACLDEHRAQVWRAQWNITGTVLSSSGDDGTVRVWKATGPAATQWKCIQTIRMNQRTGTT